MVGQRVGGDVVDKSGAPFAVKALTLLHQGHSIGREVAAPQLQRRVQLQERKSGVAHTAPEVQHRYVVFLELWPLAVQVVAVFKKIGFVYVVESVPAAPSVGLILIAPELRKGFGILLEDILHFCFCQLAPTCTRKAILVLNAPHAVFEIHVICRVPVRCTSTSTFRVCSARCAAADPRLCSGHLAARPFLCLCRCTPPALRMHGRPFCGGARSVVRGPPSHKPLCRHICCCRRRGCW